MTKAHKINADEQYKLILECRSSGLSDYQWCNEHGIKPGTFYNWVKRLRKKACYDIPAAAGRNSYNPAPAQDVVPLLILNEEPKVPSVQEIEHNACIGTNDQVLVAELSVNGVSVRITNDSNTRIFSQILEFMGGRAC